MNKIIGAVTLMLVTSIISTSSLAKSNPYSWEELKKDTDVVLMGTVTSAELLVKPDDIAIVGRDKMIKLKVALDEVLYKRISFAKPSNTVTLYLTGYKNRIPVGEFGAFFLKCEEDCMVVDEQNGAWLTTPKRTGNFGSKVIHSTNVFNTEALFLFNMPKELWSNHYEWTYSKDKDIEYLQEISFITEDNFSKKIALLLKPSL